MKIMVQITGILFFLLFTLPSFGIVHYEEGRMEVNGIVLLQDSENENAYYYVTPYPRLSVDRDGNFEFLCIKYVSPDGKEASGGIFHALITFDLPQEEKKALQAELKKINPKAVLMGVVPMKDAMNDGEEGISSFRIVSSILNQSDDNPFQTDVVTSGRAPFLPGSKAALAARLDADGATLLWESFQANTSDVSVVVDGYYEALVKGYKAVIDADLEIVYDHFSSFENNQLGFTRDQAREVLDSMAQTGVINIEVADRSEGLNINTEAYQRILDVITERVVDMMFNVKSGWAKMPEVTTATEPNEIKERYKRGAFVRFFAGDGAQPYIPDDLLLLKEKREIRNFKFYLNMTQSTSIKVPVYSAGNLNGFFDEYQEDNQYFQVVNLEDPVFQNRELHFQVDGNYVDAYKDLINFATVSIRKNYADNHPFTGDLLFKKEDMAEGKYIQSIKYPRLGQKGTQWAEYEYKVAWSLIGMDTILYTPSPNWTQSDIPMIPIKPPFNKRLVEIDADRSLFESSGIRSARIRFAAILVGKPLNQKTVVLRHDDSADTKEVAIYHDFDQAVVYQVTWYSNLGRIEDELKVLDGGYLYLVPPGKNDFENK